MTPSELGRIIKEARLAKKLTQSEVVGDFITRNMLSRIESGAATPSVKTLEYLTGVLDLPPLKLGGGDDPLDLLAEAKSALESGDFDGALAAEGITDPRLSDERDALLARAYLGLCRSAEPRDAALYASKAAELSQSGAYRSTELRNEALMRMGLIADALKKLAAEG